MTPIDTTPIPLLIASAVLLWVVVILVWIRAHYRDKTITQQIGRHNYTQFVQNRATEHPEWDHFDQEDN